ncbi:MAG: hypothetical protein R6X02_04215 [Enhygromyxa sp.]
MTFAVPPPSRRCAPLLAAALSVQISAIALAGSDAVAAPATGEPEGPDPSSPDSVDGDLGAIDDGPDTTPEASADEHDAEPIRPPRVDGPYVGVLGFGTANFASVIDLDTPTPLFGGGGFVQAGDAVFPWLSIGIAMGGQTAVIGKQRLNEGALLVELAFVPVKRYPLSIRTGFGFGGGAVREQGIDRRFGFGGALFKGSLRYEFFPLAGKNRPDRGGGWAIGPELGWLGATPAAKGQPFVNTILLGISTSFYLGS